MIYIVLDFCYEDSEIIGVYDKKELAERLLEVNKDFKILEYKLNELSKEGKDYMFCFIKNLKEKLNIKEEN